MGFKEEKKVDMKIYQAPSSVAIWFKNWCDEQGMRMSEGMVLIKQIITSYEERQSLESHISENRYLIDQLFEVLKEKESKPVEQKPQKKKTFGSSKRSED